MSSEKPNYQSEEWSRIFRNLLADIKSQQCVLLIGPEVVSINDIPISTFLREKLLRSNTEDIVHYYQKDGFFLFRDKIAKEDVQREVRLFYEEYRVSEQVEEGIYRQMAEIPFHLVISINPDTYLSDVFYRHGIKHRFGYFQTNGGAVLDVEEPTKNIPLLYNLCGIKEEDESLILDYDDLFRLMKSIFGAPGLPTKLKTTLESAKTFICLGFDFEKWYSQLLLRLLSEKKGSGIKKYAINTNIADADTSTFLIHQFGITFLGEDREFFQELYKRCKDEVGLRDTTSSIAPGTGKVLDALRLGNMGQALTEMEYMVKGSRNEPNWVLLSGQFYDLENRRQHGTIDMRDYFVRRNQVADSIIDIVYKSGSSI